MSKLPKSPEDEMKNPYHSQDHRNAAYRKGYLDGIAALKLHSDKMEAALKKAHLSLEEGGAYIVEDGFEEPEHCALFRSLDIALAEYQALFTRKED
jgi:hypothetical protein